MEADKFERDLVYVYMHPRAAGKQVPNVSPFTVKMETWLRINNIKYQTIATDATTSPTKQLPYIWYNGTVLGDSGLIINFLTRQFKLDPTEGLTPEQSAVARAFSQMIEEGTSWKIFHFRYCQHMDLYSKVFCMGEDPAVDAARKKELADYVTSRCHAQGIGRKHPDDIANMGKEDFRAIAQFLGDKPFLMGDDPTNVDCSLFGLLSQVLVDVPFPQKEVLENEGKNLIGYVERMKARAWPDWDQIVDSGTFY